MSDHLNHPPTERAVGRFMDMYGRAPDPLDEADIDRLYQIFYSEEERDEAIRTVWSRIVEAAVLELVAAGKLEPAGIDANGQTTFQRRKVEP